MTEIKKSSDSYGGSLGLHTTVNMGLRLLKPRYMASANGVREIDRGIPHTTDRKLRATCDKLKEVSPLR